LQPRFQITRVQSRTIAQLVGQNNSQIFAAQNLRYKITAHFDIL